MKIGIEAERANNRFKTGVEHYAKQLILHLAEVDKNNEYILYLRTKPEGWFLNLPKNFKIKVIPFPVFWTQIRLSLEMFLNPVDVLFIPASAMPVLHPKKTVVTIHDVAWKYFPKSFTWFMRNFLEWSTGFAVKQSSDIIAVSESTKNDILKFYNCDPKKVKVIYHGYGNKISNLKFQISNNKLPNKYILFLSTLQPRKNLEGLMEAFKLLKSEHKELEHKLLVVGKIGWKYSNILKKIEQNKEDVVYLNYVSDKEKQAILSNAELLVLPSFYEGFGMQILEAFDAGVPVATSKISSMPEVAGEAGVYFDPNNIGDIKKTIASVIFDKSLANNLRIKGHERLQKFSWEKCAKVTMKVFEL